MVLGRSAYHCGPADIDIFDCVLETAIGVGDSLLEWIKIDYHQVNRVDVVFLHDRIIDSAAPENAAMNLGMQSFDASRHHFGETGVRGDFGDRDTLFGNQSGSTAGGK